MNLLSVEVWDGAYGPRLEFKLGQYRGFNVEVLKPRLRRWSRSNSDWDGPSSPARVRHRKERHWFTPILEVAWYKW